MVHSNLSNVNSSVMQTSTIDSSDSGTQVVVLLHDHIIIEVY